MTCVVARSILISFLLFLGVVAFAGPLCWVSAQTVARRPTATIPAGGARTSETTEPPSIQERQYLMRSMEIEATRLPLTVKQKKLALAQIADDYATIQVINNKMMSAAMSAAVPNYTKIAETTSEIGKRATRIKANLPLPEDDKKDDPGENPPEYKSPSDPAGMKASLLLLDARIMSFVNNPIFQNTAVVQVGEAARAKRDLDLIVEFTARIARDAKRLRKPPDK